MPAPVLAVKAAVVTLIGALFPDTSAVQAAYGTPGAVAAQDVVLVGDARVTVSRPTMGPRRSREHAIELDVVFDCFRFGGAEQQQPATEAALAALDVLEEHLRVPGNETLTGTCREAWVSGYELTEPDDAEETGQGRRSIVTATITAAVRT